MSGCIAEKIQQLNSRQELLAREWEEAYGSVPPLVWGEGSLAAAIMMIGEAPGKNEVAQGRPFVGKAGDNLNYFLASAFLKREDIYITNAVKIRPTKMSSKGTLSNRPPNTREIAICRRFLLQEILLVSPDLIVTLGNVPLKCLLQGSSSIGTMHGAMHKLEIMGNAFSLFPLYHPASIIYNRSLQSVYEDDIKRLSELIVNQFSFSAGVRHIT